MPSYGGAAGPDGSKKSGDQGQGSRDSKGGQTGGKGGRDGKSGARGTKSQQQDRRNKERAKRSGNSAPGVKGGNQSNPAMNAVPGFRNVALSNAGLPQQPGYGPPVQSRGSNRPTGTRSVASYSSLTPNGVPPATGVMGGVGMLADAIMNDDAYGTYGEPDLAPTDITTRDMGLQDGNLRGGTGANQDREASGAQWLDNRRAAAPAAQTPQTPKTIEEYLNELKSNYIDPNMRYYLEQRGLVNPTDAPGIPEEWMGIQNREFDRIRNQLPTDLIDPKAKDADVFNQLRNYYSDQFGKNALDSEELRRRNEFTNQLNAKGYRGQVESGFGDTADDDIINSIINPQYQSAQDLLTNQQKRGTLTGTGYNYGMQQLGEQKNAANTKLQGIGAGQRATASGGVNDYLDEIYGKAGNYKLGEQFDPNAFDSEFGSRLTSAKSGLEGGIRGAAPSNLFDTSTVLSNAGTAQGQSSRGGLLDTLANRNRGSGRSRGLGTQGAF
jgi:hypothetical protein